MPTHVLLKAWFNDAVEFKRIRDIDSTWIYKAMRAWCHKSLGTLRRVTPTFDALYGLLTAIFSKISWFYTQIHPLTKLKSDEVSEHCVAYWNLTMHKFELLTANFCHNIELNSSVESSFTSRSRIFCTVIKPVRWNCRKAYLGWKCEVKKLTSNFSTRPAENMHVSRVTASKWLVQILL